MCLNRCDVRIRTARSGGSGVHGWPGHHRRNHQQEPTGDRLWGEIKTSRRSTRGAEERSAVFRAHGHGTAGVRSPGTSTRVTEPVNRPADTTVPTSGVRPLDVRTTIGHTEGGTGRRQESPQDSRNGQRPTTGTGWYDTGCQTMGGRSPNFDNAVGKCAILSGPSSPDSPPATQRPLTEVSRLPGLFRVRSSSVERLGCSAPDGHTTQACQLSRQAVEDVVCIQSLERGSHRSDLATHPGELRNWARKPASF